MDALLWILLPVLVAAGSAMLSFFIMQARMEVAVKARTRIGRRIRFIQLSPFACERVVVELTFAAASRT